MAVNAPPPKDDEEQEPTDVAQAFAIINEALAQLDPARSEVAPAIRAVREALGQVGAACGLGDVVGVDMARVLADRDAVERLRQAVAALDATG